jgi:4-amino-4-deoxy-L-arabinose transferase-like glycosyltransferase
MAQVNTSAPVLDGAGRDTVRWLWVMIFVTALGRVLLSSSLGLGVDEAYTVSTARQWSLSTYDHPPMAWWLAAGALQIFGTGSALAVRLPFIVLFAVSTWLAYQLGRQLFGARAGLFGALVLNLAPVIGWTTGSFVLPDGPLIAAMLLAAYCLSQALFGREGDAPFWWLCAGAATGLACLAKLHGFFLLLGTGLFILTSAPHRRWLFSPWPYFAALVAALMFTPVILWNIQHDWVSFAFQAGRAKATKLNLAGPFIALAGQAAFMLPWVWVPVIMALGRAVRANTADVKAWFLFCLAIGPIVAFTLVALNGTHVLFHWAAPGYVFAAILLGRDIAAVEAGQWGSRWVTEVWLKFCAGSIAVVLVAAVVLARVPWPQAPVAGIKPPLYPLHETLPWDDVRTELQARGLTDQADKSGLFVAAVRWHEAGRLDWALRGGLPVRCLCADPRGYGILYDNRAMIGRDALIIGPYIEDQEVRSLLGSYFDGIEALPPIAVRQAGQPMIPMQVYRGRKLRNPGGTPNLLEPFVKRRP